MFQRLFCAVCVSGRDDAVRQGPVFPPHSVPEQLLRQRLHVGSGSAAHAALARLVPLGHRPHRGHLAHPPGGALPKLTPINYSQLYSTEFLQS